jgi:hypothetical protein
VGWLAGWLSFNDSKTNWNFAGFAEPGTQLKKKTQEKQIKRDSCREKKFLDLRFNGLAE